MAIMDIIKKRKSVRKYLEKPVPREHIVQCIVWCCIVWCLV